MLKNHFSKFLLIEMYVKLKSNHWESSFFGIAFNNKSIKIQKEALLG